MPRFDFRTALGQSIQAAPLRTGKALVFGVPRSLTGTAEGFSGLYDLATPGTGTSRVSKGLVNFGGAIDRAATRAGVDPATYRVAQATTDVAQFLAPSASLKATSAAARLPGAAGKTAKYLTKTQPLINKPVVKYFTAPTNLINVPVGTIRSQGNLSARGQDVSPKSIATSAALNTLMAGATGVVGAGAQKILADKPITPAQLAERNKLVVTYNNAQAKGKTGVADYASRKIDEIDAARLSPARKALNAVNRFGENHPIGLSTRAVDANGNPIRPRQTSAIPAPTQPTIKASPGKQTQVPRQSNPVLRVAETAGIPSTKGIVGETPVRLAGSDMSLPNTIKLLGNKQPALLGPGNIELTPSQAKQRFKALNNRGTSWSVNNTDRRSGQFTVSPEGVVRTGADAGKINVLQRGSRNGVPIKTTPYDKPQFDFTRWQDRSALGLGRETMERNLQRVAGSDAPAAQRLLVDSSRNNELARTQFANDLRRNTRSEIVDNLRIKPGSKDSALVQKYGEKLIDAGDLVNEVGEKRAGQLIQASEYFRKQYDQLIDDWNKVRGKYGFDPIPKRKDYFRHFEAIKQNANILGTIKNAKDLPTEISGITDIFSPNKPFSDAALQRKGNKTTYDAIGGFDNYIDSVSRQIFHTDTVQKGRALETAIRKAASNDPNVALPNFVANLHEWTNLVSGKKTRIDRAAEQIVGRKVYAAANLVKRRTGANMIGANISSALTNYVPFTQAIATTSKKALAKAIADTTHAPFSGDFRKIDGFTSSFLTRRFPEEAIKLTGLRNASDKASLPFKFVDGFTSRSIVAGKYFEGLEKGLNKSAAMKQADDYAAKVITDRTTGQLPNLLQTQTVGAITQFQAEVNNQVSFLVRDIPQFAKGNKAKIASSIAQFVIYSYLANEAYQAVIGRRVQLDPIHATATIANPNNNNRQRADAFKQDILGGLPFTSIFTNGRLPTSAMFPDFGSISKGVSHLGSNTNRGLREIYKGVSGPIFYGAPPFGGGQAKKTLEAANSFSKGYSETPSGKERFKLEPNVQDLSRGLLFGQYATTPGQQYVKSLTGTKVKNGQNPTTGVAKTPENPKGAKKVDAALSPDPTVRWNNMTNKARTTVAARDPNQYVQKESTRIQNDLNSGKITQAQAYKANLGVKRVAVGSQFDKNVTDLYGLTKNQINNFVKNSPDGGNLMNQLVAYDKALYDAGITSSLKFKSGTAAKSSRGGARVARASGGRGRKAAAYKAPTIPKLRVARAGTVRLRNTPVYRPTPLRSYATAKIKVPRLKLRTRTA